MFFLHAKHFSAVTVEATCVSACSGSLQCGGSQGSPSWALMAAAMALWRTAGLPSGREHSPEG